MEKLIKYTPAETMVLLEESMVSLKDLLRVTFLDLLLKQVLQVIEVKQQAHPKEPVRNYEYVVTGKNFDTYRPLPHETVFTNIFRKDRSLNVLFRLLIKDALENLGNKNNYVSVILQSKNIRPFYKTVSTFFRLFLETTFTAEGIAERREIRMMLAQLNKELPAIVNNDKKKALEILKIIGGNIFLLRNIQFEKFVFSEKIAQAGRSTSFFTGSDIYLDMYILDQFFDEVHHLKNSFDTSFGSEDSYSDGGSSCSSGCGGDGGCGGGCGGGD